MAELQRRKRQEKILSGMNDAGVARSFLELAES
jgi:hypothetical protein